MDLIRNTFRGQWALADSFIYKGVICVHADSGVVTSNWRKKLEAFTNSLIVYRVLFNKLEVSNRYIRTFTSEEPIGL